MSEMPFPFGREFGSYCAFRSLMAFSLNPFSGVPSLSIVSEAEILYHWVDEASVTLCHSLFSLS